MASVTGHTGHWTLSLFMEHMEHGSLADIVARTNRIPEAIAAKIAADVCAGFEFVRGYAARYLERLERKPVKAAGARGQLPQMTQQMTQQISRSRLPAVASSAGADGSDGGMMAPLTTVQVGRINPERVMVAAGGTVKVAFNWPTDRVKNAMESHKTPLSQMRSAHFFMAPEVLLGEGHSDIGSVQ